MASSKSSTLDSPLSSNSCTCCLFSQDQSRASRLAVEFQVNKETCNAQQQAWHLQQQTESTSQSEEAKWWRISSAPRTMSFTDPFRPVALGEPAPDARTWAAQHRHCICKSLKTVCCLQPRQDLRSLRMLLNLSAWRTSWSPPKHTPNVAWRKSGALPGFLLVSLCVSGRCSSFFPNHLRTDESLQLAQTCWA